MSSSSFFAAASSTWTLEEYCNHQTPLDWSTFSTSSSTRDFLQALELPVVHPFCDHYVLHNSITTSNTALYYLPEIPRQGPLVNHDHLETAWDVIVTLFSMTIRPLASMAELWLRFFAFLLAPPLIGLLWMWNEEDRWLASAAIPKERRPSFYRTFFAGMSCLFAVVCSIVLLTDTLYVLDFGPQLGGTLLALSTALSFRLCQKYNLIWTRRSIALLLLLCVYLVVDYKASDGSLSLRFGEPVEHATISEGLYYDSENTILDQTVTKHWSPTDWTYTYANGATPWMTSGDSRTALPFVLNQVSPLKWHRLWLPVMEEGDEEVVALDFTFPKSGYDSTKPIYMILHGINGGTHEGFIKDFAHRRTKQDGATVCVMVARGLEDLPVRGWRTFHGARWTDAHQASLAIRKVLDKDNGQLLVGVGYSMGAIILSNLVGRVGRDCALDAVIALSGGLDLRFQTNFYRAQRLFQPIVTVALRGTFLLGKWGERVRARLTQEEMKALMRGTHITDIDRHCVVPYHGFRELEHYYSEMSLLGDVATGEYDTGRIDPIRRVHQVSVPTLVVHTLDDPLISWRTVGANQGAMHPSNLTRTGSGNLMILLTKRGGHVGWPMGMFPQSEGWKWMNDIPATFVKALAKAKKVVSTREHGGGE